MAVKTSQWIYVSRNSIQSNVPTPWRKDWTQPELPEPQKIVDCLDEHQMDSGKAALLLDESWQRPLRLERESNIAKKDLDAFVRWRLKRYLPYAIEQALVRYVALGVSEQILVTSLPKPWVDGVYEACAKRGTQLGFIGGLSSLFLGLKSYANTCVVAIYADSYVVIEFDRKARFLDYTHRHLPETDQASIDIDTLVDRDLSGLNAPRLQLLNFEAKHTHDCQLIAQRLTDLNKQTSIVSARASLIEMVTEHLAAEVSFA